MKKYFYCIIMLSLPLIAAAQNVGVNGTGVPPDSSAMLDVNSQNRGLLIPRMTKLQKEAIVNPANGLLVFQTDDTTGVWYNDAGIWKPLYFNRVEVLTGTGLIGGPIYGQGTISLGNTPVLPGTYGGNRQVPVINVNAQGQIIDATVVTITELDSVAGNELTDTISGGFLDKSGAGTSLDPYKIGLRPGNITGQFLFWDGSGWQPLKLLAGAGISVNGNLITNIGDGDSANDINFGSTAGGDLSGTYPDPQVIKIQGRNVSNAAPASGQVLSWNGSQWVPLSLPLEKDSVIGNEISDTLNSRGLLVRSGAGTVGNPYKIGVNAGTTTGHVLTWDGSNWVSQATPPFPLEKDSVIGNEISDTINSRGILVRSGAGTIGSPYKIGVNAGTTPGHVLTWDGSKWVSQATPAIPLEKDSVIGNEISDTINSRGILVRSGAGTIGSPYKIGVNAGTTAGHVLTWDGSKWVSQATPAIPVEKDSVIGNEISDTIAGGFLNRTGAGTAANPYKVGLKSATLAGQVIAWDGSKWVSQSPAVPVFTEQDSVIGNEIADTLNSRGILVRSGAGTAASPYRIGVNAGISAGHVLTWDGNKWLSQATPAFPLEKDSVVGNELADTLSGGFLNKTGAGTVASPYRVGLKSGTSAGQVITWDGSKWVSQAPAVSTFTEQDSVIGNEIADTISGGFLNKSGNGTSGNPYKLGLKPGTAIGQVLTWDGSKWTSQANGALLEKDSIVGNEIADTISGGFLNKTGAGTTISPYRVGLKSGTSAGQVITWDGSKWVSQATSTFTEQDSVIGNEIADTSNARGVLVRSGAGTAASPYKLGVNAGTAAGYVLTWNGSSWVSQALPASPLEKDSVLGNELADTISGGFLNRTGAGTAASPYKVGLKGGSAAGQVLTWNGSSWVTQPAPGWGLTGNSGTVDGTNFIGTSDNVPLSFRVNNQKAGRIDNTLFNSFYGYQSGNANTTGTDNTFNGYLSGLSNTSGYQNSFFGDRSGNANTTGFYNSFFGQGAGQSTTSGAYNSFLGQASGNNNTSGSYNSFSGTQSGWTNSTGNANSFFGYQAGYMNKTASYNTAIGTDALLSNSYAAQNVALGVDALFSLNYANSNNPWATNNVAVGYQSLYYDQPTTSTNGYQNTAVGAWAMYLNTTGKSNTGSGYQALYSNSTGNENTSYGLISMYANTTGSENTAGGFYTLAGNTTGTGNTALGYRAGITATSANQNVSGSYNVYIGHNAGPASSTQFSNSIAIGKNALVNASNTMVLGGTGADAVKVGIGNTAPGAELEVTGQVKITGGAPGAGKVLTADASGLATWTTPAGGLASGSAAGNTPYWNGSSWIVNTSNIFNNGGNIGLGTTTPGAKLEVAGQVKITGGTPGAGKVLTSDAAGLATWTTPAGGLASGSAAGNTPYWNGSSWVVNTSNIFNNGANVGVGTTSPNEKLEVTGNIRLTGSSSIYTAPGVTNLTVRAGDGTGSGGALTLRGGNAGTSSGGAGGDVTISAGGNMPAGGAGYSGLGSPGILNLNGSMGYNTVGGGINLTAGASSCWATSAGLHSDVNIIGGTNMAVADAGNIIVEGGYTKNNCSQSDGGSLVLKSGLGQGGGVNGKIIMLNGNVGIGTSTPAQKLSVNGTVGILETGASPTFYSIFQGGDQSANITYTLPVSVSAGKFLNTDASGVLSWASAGWGLTGNGGTSNGTNFIGTTDNVPLTFKINNQTAGKIDATAGNVVFGYQANGSGSNVGAANTVIGSQALYSNSSGVYLTALGYQALYWNTTASYNTAIGFTSLNQTTTGQHNTAVGYFSLYSNTTGTNNTALGDNAFGSGATFSNSTALGANSSISASNQIRLGDASVTSIGGQVAWTTISDARFKKDIKETVPGLEFITKLRPVTYHMDIDAIAWFLKTPDSLRHKDSEALRAAMLQTGFIAQEVEKAAKDLGFDFSGVDKPKNADDYYGLRYAEFVVPLVKGMQEQQLIIQKLSTEVDELKKMMLAQNTMIIEMQKKK